MGLLVQLLLLVHKVVARLLPLEEGPPPAAGPRGAVPGRRRWRGPPDKGSPTAGRTHGARAPVLGSARRVLGPAAPSDATPPSAGSAPRPSPRPAPWRGPRRPRRHPSRSPALSGRRRPGRAGRSAGPLGRAGAGE